MAEFRVPAGDGEVLAVPGFDAIPKLVEENRRRLDRDDVRIDEWHDGGLRQFRVNVRCMAIIQAWEYLGRPLPFKPGTTELEHIPTVSDGSPLLVAGHQPELLHPGVWVKNFALAGLAKKLGGVAINLIVDTDTMKSTAVRVPVAAGSGPDDIGSASIPFDSSRDAVYEDYHAQDSTTFDSFADRVMSALPKDLGTPLVKRAWETIRKHPGKPIGEAFSLARRQIEREWGCDNLELPVSHLASNEYFLRFSFNICGNSEKFAEVHNAAVGDYRRRTGLRSTSHPFPNLGRDGDWFEVPFWAWSTRIPRRGRVWAKRPSIDRISFRFDNGLPEVTVPFPFTGYGPDNAALMNNEFKFRPRALTLTLFARVCLGDFFIHGIGGGKYDEVTDAIIRDYFGIEPPAYQVLSATLHLPLPDYPSTPDDLKRAERCVRDLHWNPQRHLSPGTASDLLSRKAALASSEPPLNHRESRRAWFRELQAITERLRPFVVNRVREAEAELERVRAEVAANDVLKRRDYAWVLYPEEVLRPFLQRFLDL